MSQPVRPYIGGQAVIEGVMMRAPTSIAVALRRRDGTITVRERAVEDHRKGWQKLPFLRGVASLVESLRIGNEALRFSSEKLQEDWQDDAPGGGESAGPFASVGLGLWMLMTHDEAPASAPAAEKSKSSMVVMLIVMVGVMFALPQLVAGGALKLIGADLPVQSPGYQAITGGFKLAIVLGYMLAIRRIALIRRVFQYHGAEHKTITTYEAEEPLDVEHARTKTTRHPRCGTTFLVMVVIVSVLLFTVLGAVIPNIQTGNKITDNLVFLAIKLPFIPVLAGFTFELQRIFAKYCTTGPLSVLLIPGFLVQRITTVEPDDSQLEVALASLRATLFREDGKGEEGASEVDFENYDAIAAAERLRPAA
jgi:uncharacterized protein YqhQ